MDFDHQVTKTDNLLEESWFFGNLLDHNKPSKMSRSLSDPSPSSKHRGGPGEAAGGGGFAASGLVRAPSLPPGLVGKKVVGKEEGTRTRVIGKPGPPGQMNSLRRAPSLPPGVGRDDVNEYDDPESEFCMGRLIRQASLNSSNRLLPPRHTANSKGVMQNSTVSKQRIRKKSEKNTVKTDKKNEIGQQLINQTKISRSLSDLTLKELQGFKDLGFEIDKEDQEKSSQNREEMKRKNSSEEWVVQRSAEDDLKAQIKYWARAVASNVRNREKSKFKDK